LARRYRQRSGRWPNLFSGKIPGTHDTWLRIDWALRKGYRGLPGGDSLAKLLTRKAGRGPSPVCRG
jgi:hypothetical protein